MRSEKIKKFITPEDVEFLQKALDDGDIQAYYERHTAIGERYLASFGGDVHKIVDEIEDEIKSITKADFLECLEQRKQDEKEYGAPLPGYDFDTYEDGRYTKESFENAADFIYGEIMGLVFELDRVRAPKEIYDYINKLASEKAAEWYERPGAYLPMLRTKPTSAIGLLSSTDITFRDPVTNDVTYTRDDVMVVMHNVEKATNQININIDKILSVSLAYFYKADHSPSSGLKTVIFPFEDFARARGFDIDTPGKKRKDIRDRARKEINDDLIRLMGITVSWKERTANGTHTHKNMNLVQYSEIRDGFIQVTFSDLFAAVLRSTHLATQYPTKLLSISAKDPNTYKMGKKLIEHYNHDENYQDDKNDIISVKSLLKILELQSYKDLKAKNNRNWKRLIKERFETALDNLVQMGVLFNWQYCHEKKVLLADDEVDAILDSYYNFESLYVLFEPVEKVDHSERRQNKADRIEKAKAKKKEREEKKRKKKEKEGKEKK